MYNTIGNGGSEGNIGGFETDVSPYYWSSSEFYGYSVSGFAWSVGFNDGYTGSPSKLLTYRVRVVRAF